MTPLASKVDFFEQRAADALNDVAFDLIFHAVGIDDQAAVVGADDPFDGDLASGLVDFDIDYRGDIGARASRQRDAASLWRVLPARGQRREGSLLPLGFVRRGLQTFARAFVFAQMAQAKLHRIGFQVGGDFVEHALGGEAARDVAGSAQLAGAQRMRFGETPIDKIGKDALVVDAVDFTGALTAVGGVGIRRLDADLKRTPACGVPSASVRGKLKSVKSHAVSLPSPSTAALTSSTCAGPFGDQPCSSSRDHCTRTGAPTARESSAASSAGIFRRSDAHRNPSLRGK